MKRFGIGLVVLGLVGLILFALSGCTQPHQVFVKNVDGTAKLIDPKLRAYVKDDAKLKAEEKDDWYKLLDSFRRLIDAAKEKD